jgi:hypothetical protein
MDSNNDRVTTNVTSTHMVGLDWPSPAPWCDLHATARTTIGLASFRQAQFMEAIVDLTHDTRARKRKQSTNRRH